MKTKNDVTLEQISAVLKEETKIICEHMDKKFEEMREAFDYKQRIKKWNSDLWDFAAEHKVWHLRNICYNINTS